MVKRSLELVLVSSLAAFTLPAAGESFVGKWRLNPGKSTVIDEMRVEAAGPNKYTLIFSSAGTETIAADGRDHPGLAGTTLSLTVEAPAVWKVVRKKARRTLLTAMWGLSKDGITLHDRYTEYSPDGSPSTTDYLYTRTLGSSGFTGTWDTTIEQTKAVELEVRLLGPNGLSLVRADEQRTERMKFDGKDYVDVGQGAVVGVTSSGRMVNEDTVELTRKLNGNCCWEISAFRWSRRR